MESLRRLGAVQVVAWDCARTDAVLATFKRIGDRHSRDCSRMLRKGVDDCGNETMRNERASGIVNQDEIWRKGFQGFEAGTDRVLSMFPSRNRRQMRNPVKGLPKHPDIAYRLKQMGVFRKLFGGGKADIVLETPEDVLESGIDILARPPGKELQSISLLSGGEKAMTAIALVLAVFKSKPSPFCVLDEVDAPLDEANTGRFAAIIQEFLAHSQFIVITHNKRMMAIANILYGITMQEQGVSKRVAVRFDGKPQLEPVVKTDAVASGASEAA